MRPSLFIVVACKTNDRMWNRFIISLVVVRYNIPNMMSSATTAMTEGGASMVVRGKCQGETGRQQQQCGTVVHR